MQSGWIVLRFVEEKRLFMLVHNQFDISIFWSIDLLAITIIMNIAWMKIEKHANKTKKFERRIEYWPVKIATDKKY